MISEKILVEIFKNLKLYCEIGLIESVSTIRNDLAERGYNFYVWDYEPKEVMKGDRDYMWIEVKFSFNIGIDESKFPRPFGEDDVLIPDEDNLVPRGPIRLCKWTSIYCMTRSDIHWNNWSKSNIWMDYSTCKISDLLEVLGLKFNAVDCFKDFYFSRLN